jgi:hypothetical protein
MKRLLAVCLITVLMAGPAAAQLRGPRPFPGPLPQPTLAQASITGCLARQVWDVQDIDNYTAQIWLNVAGATERFNFQPNRVEMIAPTGTPLTTREQAMKYEMIIRSIEAAGVARRQITVDYETATRRVFGITIEWAMPACP